MTSLRGLFLFVVIIMTTGAGALWSADSVSLDPTDFTTMANAADPYYSSGVKEITADQLWSELNDADTTQPYLISVRLLEDDTLRGHIPGSHHWDPASLVKHRDQFPKDKKIVVYCYTGQSSSMCTAFLNLAGYNAYTLEWGLCSWTSDTAQIGMGGGWFKPTIGHQKLEATPHTLTKEYPFPQPKAKGTGTVDLFCANFEPQVSKPTSQWAIKSATDVYANLEDGDTTNDWFVIYYGPKSFYDAGHIPGAYLIEPGSLGTNENLKYLPPDRPIIVYCLNGHWSLQAVTLLNSLGYNAYAITRGLNSITDDDEILGPARWVPDIVNFPMVRGMLPCH